MLDATTRDARIVLVIDPGVAGVNTPTHAGSGVGMIDRVVAPHDTTARHVLFPTPRPVVGEVVARPFNEYSCSPFANPSLFCFVENLFRG